MRVERDKRVLLLFTEAYPSGNAGQFIHNELPFLLRTFERIYVFPMRFTGPVKRSLPQGVEVVKLFEDVSYRKFELLKRFPHILRLIRKEKFNSPPSIRQHLRFLHLFKKMHHAYAFKNTLEGWMVDHQLQNAVVYNYWFYDWSIVLGLLHSEGKLNKYVSRAHMGDVYHNMKPDRIIPFQYFKLQNCYKTLCVSEDGANYLRNLYPSMSGKVGVAHLGAEDSGVLSPFEPSDGLIRIVSCSSCTPRKRVNMILEILKEFDGDSIDVEWIHFGRGALLEQLRSEAALLPSNIKATLPGFTPNKEIKEYYQENHIDVFLNVSEAEGIPVSIMEAISFGIPVAGFDVYGNREIINNTTGFLLSPSTSVSDFKKRIVAARNSDSLEKREGIREFFLREFHDQTNYLDFIESNLG